MAYFNEFPNTRTYDSDLGWLIKSMRQLASDVQDINAIQYHDPIGWNITTQYERNTIVKDPESGILYLSKQPVPTGISLTNSDYWLEIGDMSYDIDFLKAAMAVPDEGMALQSAHDYSVNDVLWWEDELYITIAAIAIGDVFTPGTNIRKISIGESITELLQADINTDAELDEIRDELAFKLLNNPKILLMGDSNMIRMYNSNMFNNFLPDATISNLATSGAKWADVVTQVGNISETPDVILMCCGGNDVSAAANYTAGTLFGAPDITNHNYPNSPTLVFDCIKYVFGELRKNYPTTQIYFLQRSDREDVNFNIRNYLYYYTAQIAAEYGVSLVDLQSIVNYAYFVAQQRAIYNDDGGNNAHYSNAMYSRICNRLAGILVSGSPTTWNSEPPESYYIPNFGNNEATMDGLASMLNYVANHCRTKNGVDCFNKMITVYGSSRYTSGWLLRSTGRCRLGLQSANGMYYADGDINNDIVTGTVKVLNSTAIALAQNIDLNDQGEPGLYFVPGDQTVANLPSNMTDSTKMFVLLVISTGNYLWQWVYNRYNAALWFRFGTNGSPINWRTWTKIGV